MEKIMKSGVTFMAFARGKETIDVEVKRYTGVGSVFVKAVNPSKAELEKIYNTTLEKEPEYTGEMEISGAKSKFARVDFIVSTDPEKNNGISMNTKVTFFVRDDYQFNKDQTKVKVIDKYGRTAWVTVEQAKNHEIPMYKNGPANLDADYRVLHIGEEDLTNFIIAYLNIPSVQRYVNGKWEMVENPEESEARLDKIKSYLKGDFSELKSIVKMQPNNKVKVLFGVRTADNGNQYQTAFTRKFARNGSTNYNSLFKELHSSQDAGAYANTEFSETDLQEYNVQATTFSSSSVDSDLPFGNETQSAGSESKLPWD